MHFADIILSRIMFAKGRDLTVEDHDGNFIGRLMIFQRENRHGGQEKEDLRRSKNHCQLHM